MAEYEEKFIVINKKRFPEMIEARKHAGKMELRYPVKLIENLEDAVHMFRECYETVTSKELNQKYYVCNQDEPYAQKVIEVILQGEDEKATAQQ